jgi:hypothetical protein
MSCPYCHGTRRIPIEPGSTTGYECPDCREIDPADIVPADELTCDDRDTITD